MSQLTGVYLPICTIFNDDESLNESACVENMRHYAETGVKGYLVLGSNGENKSLSFDEQVRVAQLSWENKGADQVIMLGALYESEKLTLDFLRAAEGCLHYATMLPPSYFRKQMTDDALYGFFSRMADAAPVPVMLYNAPGFTGTELSTALVERLCTHENIAGLKDSGKGDIDRFFHLVSHDFSVLSGSVSFFLKALKGGCPGGICSLGNVFPREACKLYDLFMAGDMPGAERQDELLRNASKAVGGAYGVSGVKRAMDWVGLNGGKPRRPLMPVPDDEAEVSRKRLAELGLL